MTHKCLISHAGVRLGASVLDISEALTMRVVRSAVLWGENE